MQLSWLFITTLSVVSAAPAISDIEASFAKARQAHDTLNRQLQPQNRAHVDQSGLNELITNAGTQIDNTLATVGHVLTDVTSGLEELLVPLVDSVTSGANALLATLLDGGADNINAQSVAPLTKSYSKFASFASQRNVDSSRLQQLSQEITKASSGKAKRNDQGMDHTKEAIANSKQIVDSMKTTLESHHAEEALHSFLTGVICQVDNVVAIITKGLDDATLGLTGAVGDLLLGPFIQSVLHGVEALVSKVVGGTLDIVTDGTTKVLCESLGELHKISIKLNVCVEDTDALMSLQNRVSQLQTPK